LPAPQPLASVQVAPRVASFGRLQAPSALSHDVPGMHFTTAHGSAGPLSVTSAFVSAAVAASSAGAGDVPLELQPRINANANARIGETLPDQIVRRPKPP
jgi:hypothetical protein